MTERLKLTVTELKEVQKGQRKEGKGEWQRLSFKAKNGEGEHWYFSLSPTLFPSIVVGQTVEADVIISETDRGTERKVTQVYVGGQGVAAKFEPGGRSYQRPDDSPEKRASIEAQSSLNFAGVLMASGVMKTTDPLGIKAIAWALSRLGHPTVILPIEETVAVPQKGNVPTETKAEMKPESKDFPPENVGQMLWHAKAKGKSRAEVLAFLGEKDAADIKVDKVKEAWPKVKAWLEKK